MTIVGPISPSAIERGDSGERVVNVGDRPSSAGGRRVLAQSGVWIRTAQSVRRLASELDVTLLLASLTSVLGLRTALLRKVGGRPVVVYVTGLAHPRAGYHLGLAANRALVGSEFLQQWLPGAEVVYPLLPMALRAEAPEPKRPGGPFTVLFLGSFEPERGVEHLLQAMAMVRAKTPRPVRLLVAWNGQGEWNHDNILRLIEVLGIASIVEMRGWVQTHLVYGEADIVVIPRISEERMAFPVRVVEAMHFGTPLVVSAICGMEKTVARCGLAVEPGNVSALAEAILRLANDTTLREELAQNCAVSAQSYDDRLSIARLASALKAAACDE